MLITDPVALKRFEACHRVWQGIPGIARTEKGRTFVSFYSGSVLETYGNFAALIVSEDGEHFSEPIAVAEKPGRFRCFDPVLWIDPLKRLWFIWNVMPGEQVMAAICPDPDADPLTWKEPICIGRGIMMNKPIVLSTGEWLFPIATWKTDIYREFRLPLLTDADVPGSYVVKTADNGRTFARLGAADVRDRSFDEHMVLEQKNGVLMMLVRTVYGIGVSYSYDRGKTWSAGCDSGIPGPCSRFFIGRLKSGRVLFIHHHDFKGRNNLTAMLSEDDGKTFPYRLLLDPRDNVSYPDAVQDADGSIHIIYDRDRGAYKKSLPEALSCARELLTVRITEEDLMAGRLVSEGSYLQRIICKLGDLSPEDGDPYEQIPESDEMLADRLIEDGVEDIISEVFARFGGDCSEGSIREPKGLDDLIDRFREGGCESRALLTRIIATVRSAPVKKEDSHPLIDLAKAYMEANLTEEYSVREMAGALRVSVYYLNHLFKKTTGISPLEYRSELRLTRAKLLLITTDDSIGEIAQKTGFSGSSYFAEIFTRSERISPTLYRKYHRRKS